MIVVCFVCGICAIMAAFVFGSSGIMQLFFMRIFRDLHLNETGLVTPRRIGNKIRFVDNTSAQYMLVLKL